MEKIKIDLDDDKYLQIFGINNKNIDLIKKRFPELEILNSGHTIILKGEIERINKLSKLIETLKLYIDKHNTLKDSIMEDILDGNINDDNLGEKDDDYVLTSIHNIKIKAISFNQRKMIDEIKRNDMMFAVGPAGTGKTYFSVALAVKALKDKSVKKIILCRPAVESGENLGFLPGDLKEKLDPYLQPLYDALRDFIHPLKLESYYETGVIQIIPLAFMRGRTLDKCFVILDEAQNTTVNQIKMFLTRMGKNAKFIITGDPSQIDLPKNQKSGLIEAKERLENIKDISFVQFDDKDVVRHELVKKIIKAFEN